MNRRISLALFSSLIASVMVFGILFVQSPYTHAQEVENIDDRIEEQNIAVHMKIVETLESYLKLLQLTTIKRLQAQVASLQARVNAQ